MYFQVLNSWTITSPRPPQRIHRFPRERTKLRQRPGQSNQFGRRRAHGLELTCPPQRPRHAGVDINKCVTIINGNAVDGVVHDFAPVVRRAPNFNRRGKMEAVAGDGYHDSGPVAARRREEPEERPL